MKILASILTVLFFTTTAQAADLSGISNTEATGGLKDALVQAAGSAVGKLGTPNGFLKNPKVKIPLPGYMQKAEKAMRLFGMGDQADELELKMNRAAEAAVPEGKAVLVDAVKRMTVQDAKDILTGGDDSVTQYFKKTTSASLTAKFLPIVTDATKNVQLAQQYNKFAESGMKYGLVNKDQATMEQYVTQKTLDGLYLMMADEEKAIRKNPLGASTSLIKKVFGSLGN